NPSADRYAVELDIISVEMHIGSSGGGDPFPLIEVLRPTIVDTRTGARIEGIVGNNFSSYVRDYDFSVVLPASNEGKATFGIPEGFGDLHGKLFKHFLESEAYRTNF
ncbi:putative oxygenase MesX, partial [Enterobacter hormaechei]